MHLWLEQLYYVRLILTLLVIPFILEIELYREDRIVCQVDRELPCDD